MFRHSICPAPVVCGISCRATTRKKGGRVFNRDFYRDHTMRVYKYAIGRPTPLPYDEADPVGAAKKKNIEAVT